MELFSWIFWEDGSFLRYDDKNLKALWKVHRKKKSFRERIVHTTKMEKYGIDAAEFVIFWVGGRLVTNHSGNEIHFMDEPFDGTFGINAFRDVSYFVTDDSFQGIFVHLAGQRSYVSTANLAIGPTDYTKNSPFLWGSGE